MTGCTMPSFLQQSRLAHRLGVWRWREQSAIQGVVPVPGLGCITVLGLGIVGVLVLLVGVLTRERVNTGLESR